VAQKKPSSHWVTVKCPTCEGSGKRGDRKCGLCKGLGTIRVPPEDKK
jgi:DnaJ-class molecular chaperone